MCKSAVPAPLKMVAICLLLLLCVATGYAHASSRGLWGGVGLTYGGRDYSRAGLEDTEQSFFSQQYVLGYGFTRDLARGRLGQFSFDIGYEWLALNTDVNGVTDKVDTDKLLFNGEIELAPKGLPFYLDLYSRDMQRSHFGRNRVGSLFDDYSSYGGFMGDSMRPVSNIFNGTHIRNGATLMVGINNGHYQGEYRDLLAHAPKLLVDYSEDIVEDHMNEIDYVARNLAFVSLNKKDNWLHVRQSDYQNNYNHDEDFSEYSMLLGTIDHHNQRRWINLTNWVKLSTDISFADHAAERTDDSHETYYANLFFSAQREKYSIDVFNNFARKYSVSPEEIERTLEVPVYFRYNLSEDSDVRAMFIGEAYEVNRSASLSEFDNDYYATLKHDYVTQGGGRFSYNLAAETREWETGEGNAFEAGVDYYYAPRRRSKTRYSVGYKLASFDGEDAGFKTEFLENSVFGSVTHHINAGWSLGFTGSIAYGSGTIDGNLMTHIHAMVVKPLRYSHDHSVELSHDTLRYMATLFTEAKHNRLANRIELSYDFKDNGVEAEGQYVASHRLDYDDRDVRLTLLNRYLGGDGLYFANDSVEGLYASEPSSSDYEQVFESSADLRYTLNRYYLLTAGYQYEKKFSSDSGTDALSISQELQRVFFKTNGMVRKYVEVIERLEYEWSETQKSGIDDEYWALSLESTYWPRHWAFVSGRVRYLLDINDESGYQEYAFKTGVRFRRLSVELKYSYGEKNFDSSDSSGSSSDENESLYELSLNKTF
ncbi:MAG: hypothetical protein C0624_01745 [Desulfuromonas sp.]|nr:MAG: hypothetical protein C0624_01745 [Desulfuromonas sp.]